MDIEKSDPLDFQLFFHSIRNGFLIVNRDLRISFVNPALLELRKWSSNQVVGKSILEVFPGDLVKNKLSWLLDNSVPVDIEFIDEKENVITLACTPISGKNRKASHIAVEVLPMPLGSPQEQLLKSKELFANLFEFNPAALAISRIGDAQLINVNGAFLELFDFTSKDDVIGKTSSELNIIVEPERRNDVLNMLNNNSKKVNMEGSIRTGKGKIKWVSTSIINVIVENQPCMMAVLIDSTARKEAESRIISTNAALEHQVAQRTKELLQREVEYHSVIEQATDGIFISDVDGRYVDVNPSACKLLGYSKEELLTLNVRDVLHPDELRTKPPRFQELQEGKAFITNRQLVRKDGKVVSTEINSRMLSNGKMLGMVRDVTERKNHELEILAVNAQLEEKVRTRTAELEKKVIQLKESDEKFQKAFNASSAGIAMTKLSTGQFVDVNPAFLNMIGYSRREVINKSSVDLGLIVNLKKREEVLNYVREKGSMNHMEMTIRRKTGDLLEVLSSIETISFNEEKYAINIVYDITEQKRAQEQLKEVNRELEAFSYSVSHDLRAPLRSILGYTGIIQEDFGNSINESVRHQLDRIKSNATRMGQLIDDLLEFSRVGKQEQTKSLVNTHAVVEKIIYDLKTHAHSTVDFRILELHPSIADLSMINQVWMNLISNAIKYSSKKKKPLVEIGSTSAPTETIFYVRDNGAGFNMEFHSKLFGVFQRLHGTTEFEGTGVGLALVKRIVEKHGGRVWAEGKENEGATFYFSLPTE